MPKDDISHLPPEVQASIKAAKQRAEEKKAEKDDKAISHLPPEVQASIKAARQRAEEKKAEEKKTYVVQPGDSLSKIAKELLGDAARWPEIFELNKDQIKDPNLIQVGQELRIP